jgi:hypothetical protein
MLAVAAVSADGPVQQVIGVTTVDSDSGSGEQWGRTNGRTFTFTVTDISTFAALHWGSVGTPPSAALDDDVNAPGEVMTFDAGSDLMGGVARWTGQADLPLLNGGVLPGVPTRFTLTVETLGGVPVPLSNVAGGPQPGVDVKTVGSFRANLLFEMQRVAGMPGPIGQWEPLLTLYDSLPITPTGNPPGEGGPVLTSFATGFYFTGGGVPSGMTIEAHDANITQRLNVLTGQAASIKDDTGFMRGETVGRLIGLGNKLNEVEQLVRNPPIPQDIARRSDVQSANSELMQTLMILFGVMPCPEPAMCDAIKQISELATQASVDQVGADVNELGGQLNGLAAQDSVNQLREQLNNVQATLLALGTSVEAARGLELQVVDLTGESSHRRRWLVRTSLNGMPVASELAGLVAIGTFKKHSATTIDVTPFAKVRELMPGVLEVVLDAKEPKLSNLAFHFSVRHTAVGAVLTAQSLVANTEKDD